MEGKHAFEKYAAIFGVKIQKYHADNGAFNNRILKERRIATNQIIGFSPIYAHHQNGIAERTIKNVTYISQSTIFNAMI